MGKRIAILALTYGRLEMTRKTWQHNLNKAGCEFDLFWWDNGSETAELFEIDVLANEFGLKWSEYCATNKGIATALNTMIRLAFNSSYDYVVTMANDILEPDEWVKLRVEAADKIEQTAVVAIPPGEAGVVRYRREGVSGIKIDNGQVIGNWLITREAFDKIGVFNSDYGIYGPLDLDYCDRAAAAGMRTYYLSDQLADHIGDPAKNPVDYQKAKTTSLHIAWPKYAKNKALYQMGINIKQ